MIPGRRGEVSQARFALRRNARLCGPVLVIRSLVGFLGVIIDKKSRHKSSESTDSQEILQ